MFWLQVTQLAPFKVTKRACKHRIRHTRRHIHAKAVIKDGRKIYYLNIGDPAAFDFNVPPHVKDALCKAVQEDNNYYSPSEGIPELGKRSQAKRNESTT